MGAYRAERADILRRWTDMQTERSSWIGHWRELGDLFLPRAPRFYRSDRNQGQKKHNNVLDNTPIRANRILGAGMMSGATSPARPWFRLQTPDEHLNDYAPVKEWLSDVQRIMLHVFARSNTYLMLHQLYEEMGTFGTHAVITMEDFQKVTHHYNSPTGEFAIASDYRGSVNTIYREFEKPVSEIVGEFGIDRCSKTVKHLYNSGALNTWVPLLHVIEPRKDRDATSKTKENKAWKSCYMELGREDVGDVYLREGGFDEFPGIAPRWSRFGNDVYGSSPAMDVLGDARQLQHQQLRKANAIDFQTKPPIQLPTAAKGQDKNYLPGGVMYFDSPGAGNSARTLFDVNLNLDHLRLDIEDVRQRIREGMHADLFLMLANLDKNQMTAREVAERHEEKLVQLGPVLERLHYEGLGPLTENTFLRVLRAGLLPPPPQELQEQELNVEFISTLAQAQRAVGVNAIDRFVANIGVIAAFKPDVVDKFNADKWADAYGDMMGIDPEMIVADDQVAIVRSERAKQMAQAAAAENAKAMGQAASGFGSVNTAEPNLATDMMNQFAGYSAPAGAPAQ